MQKQVVFFAVHTHTHAHHNLVPSSKLHASLFTLRGHSTSWPVGQQAVQLISGEPPLSLGEPYGEKHHCRIPKEAFYWHHKKYLTTCPPSESLV